MLIDYDGVKNIDMIAIPFKHHPGPGLSAGL